MTSASLLSIDFTNFFRILLSPILVTRGFSILLFHSYVFMQEVSLSLNFIQAHTFSMGF
jgi:hypothetical protein